MNMGFYTRLTKGLNDKGNLFEANDVYNHIDNANQDWYTSVFYYNDEQLAKFKKDGTIAGITDVTGDSLVFDFDSLDNLDLARTDALTLISRLETLGVPQEQIGINFSGQKGFTVQIKLDRMITPEQARDVAMNQLGEGLQTLDSTMYNSSRILRVPFTQHQKSKLFKIPLTLEQLNNLSISQIKKTASNLANVPDDTIELNPVTLPPKMFAPKIKEKKTLPLIAETKELNLQDKPKWLTNCRWSLQNGFFSEGKRSHVFTCLAATYKNQGFTKDITYRLLKGVAETQAKRNNVERWPDKEIWNNVVMTVYNNTWNDGQYSCRKEGWLHDYCQSLGPNKCDHKDDQVFSDFNSITNTFKDFAVNLEQNIIKTGIEGFDREVTLTTSMLVGLLGAPSSGKTLISTNILNNASVNGLQTAFYSLDMGSPLVTMRLIQRHTGLSQKEIYEIYKNKPEAERDINKLLEENYANVKFCFKSGMTVDDIRRSVVDHRLNTGQPLKLIVVDYLECLSSGFSDLNASVALISKQLKDLANDEKLLVLLLLQTQKHSGDPSEPLMSMRNVKGASTIEQDCSVIISLYREGFSATTPENDKFITLSAVKNRMGQLCSLDFAFNGAEGKIGSLTDEGYQELKELREFKKNAKNAEGNSW